MTCANSLWIFASFAFCELKSQIHSVTWTFACFGTKCLKDSRPCEIRFTEKDKIIPSINELILAYCEICGNLLSFDKVDVLVDGVQLTVCKSCSKRGKPVSRPAIQNLSKSKKFQNPRTNRYQIMDDSILVEDYAAVIRKARMQKNLTHEQLGSMLKEKATLLRRFETGSLKPDRNFAIKLERFLGIKLYVAEDE
jgi:putative transcription factor